MNIEIKETNYYSNQVEFVKYGGEWWAVAEDIAEALNYRTPDMVRMIPERYRNTVRLVHRNTGRGNPNRTIIHEKGIYMCIMRSDRPEALDFQDWVFDLLQQYRSSELQMDGYDILNMTGESYCKTNKVLMRDYIWNADLGELNKIEKLVDRIMGEVMMKSDMCGSSVNEDAEYLIRRAIKEDTVQLYAMDRKFNLGLDIEVVLWDRFVANMYHDLDRLKLSIDVTK